MLYHFCKVMTDFRKQGKWINYNVLSSSISIGSLEKWYYCWGGAGLQDCGLLTIIVGEPAPTSRGKMYIGIYGCI